MKLNLKGQGNLILSNPKLLENIKYIIIVSSIYVYINI